MARPKRKLSKSTEASINEAKNKGFIEKIQSDLESNQSILSLFLGVLIVAVIGVLLFNYFSKQQTGDIGSSQQTDQQTEEGDVSKENLPGKYTVKEGDTLFTIAENYYNDGFQYEKIVTENNLSDPNNIEVGQVLDIPRIEEIAKASESPEPSESPEQILTIETPSLEKGIGGAENQTTWGEKISEDTYTVQEGDWLSTIAGRAYGDIYQFEKIAQANNISNPDLIEPGILLKLPR